MLDICLLGTGGTMPLPQRALTALIVRYMGRNILIDCGEGTQVMIRKSGFSMSKIDVILITHFHADHISGLPGLLLSMGKSERSEPVKIIGPKGLCSVVSSLCVIAPDLGFEVECSEISDDFQSFDLNGLRIEALKVDHSVTCYSYCINLDRRGKFDSKKAERLGIDLKFWKQLQQGLAVEENGCLFTPEMVLGKPRKGLKVTYCTDTRPTEEITVFAKNSDLFICEGMYADEEKKDKAVINRHMLFSEACETAKQAEVNQLWLTHFSPSIKDPCEHAEFAKKLFPKTKIPCDLESIELKFL